MRGTRTKRLNLNLPEVAYDELKSLAADSGRSMTDIVRTGLSLASLAMDEANRDNVLAVASRDGEVLREVILPR